MDVANRKITVKPETLGKIRCYGCGKVFGLEIEQKYKNVLVLNDLLRGIDRTRLENNGYTNEELVLMGIKLKLTEEEPEEIHAKVLLLFDEYFFEPFNILEESEEGKELVPYINKHKRVLQGLGVKRLCCSMHFQTPFLISTGMSNQITAQGLTNQLTEGKQIKKEIDDSLNIMKGNIVEEAEPAVVKRKRAVKPKAEIIRPDEVPIQGTGMGVKGNGVMSEENKEAIQRDVARQLMNMREFVAEELEIPIEINDLAAHQHGGEILPMETPAQEKGAGRLVYPKEVSQVQMKKGRGRPKKEK